MKLKNVDGTNIAGAYRSRVNNRIFCLLMGRPEIIGYKVQIPIRAVTRAKYVLTRLPLLLLYIKITRSQQIIAAEIEQTTYIFIRVK